MRYFMIVLLAAVLPGMAFAEMLVPVTLQCTCVAETSYYGGGPVVTYSDTGINHAAVGVGSGVYGQISCNSGTTGPASIEASSQSTISNWVATTGIDLGSQLTIGTSPSAPAGTPLTLLVSVTGVSGSMGYVELRRDTQPLFQAMGVPFEGSFEVLAGETLLILGGTGSGTPQSPSQYSAYFQTVPEPTSLLLLAAALLLVRR